MRNYLDRGNNAVRWLCYTCVYPECNTCHQRPKFPLAGTVTAESYICETCIRPPCDGDGCSEPRPLTVTVHVARKWYCPKCRAKPAVCITCGEEKSADEFDRYKSGKHDKMKSCRSCRAIQLNCALTCANCKTQVTKEELRGNLCADCDMFECNRCGKKKPRRCFRTDVNKRPSNRCMECELPTCVNCGAVSKERVPNSTNFSGDWYRYFS